MNSIETLLEAAKYVEYQSLLNSYGITKNDIQQPSDFVVTNKKCVSPTSSQVLHVSTTEPSRAEVAPARTSVLQHPNSVLIGSPRTSVLPPHAPNLEDITQDNRKRSNPGTREVHNKLEKFRRAHLKECFEILRKQLPNLDVKKSSNLSILRSALRYIQILKKREREHEHEMERLAREKIAAQQKLSFLKRSVSSQYDHINLNLLLPDNVEEIRETEDSNTSTASENSEKGMCEEPDPLDIPLTPVLSSCSSATLSAIEGDELDQDDDVKSIKKEPLSPTETKSVVRTYSHNEVGRLTHKADSGVTYQIKRLESAGRTQPSLMSGDQVSKEPTDKNNISRTPECHKCDHGLPCVIKTKEQVHSGVKVLNLTSSVPLKKTGSLLPVYKSSPDCSSSRTSVPLSLSVTSSNPNSPLRLPTQVVQTPIPVTRFQLVTNAGLRLMTPNVLSPTQSSARSSDVKISQGDNFGVNTNRSLATVPGTSPAVSVTSPLNLATSGVMLPTGVIQAPVPNNSVYQKLLVQTTPVSAGKSGTSVLIPVAPTSVTSIPTNKGSDINPTLNIPPSKIQGMLPSGLAHVVTPLANIAQPIITSTLPQLTMLTNPDISKMLSTSVVKQVDNAVIGTQYFGPPITAHSIVKPVVVVTTPASLDGLTKPCVSTS